MPAKKSLKIKVGKIFPPDMVFPSFSLTFDIPSVFVAGSVPEHAFDLFPHELRVL